MTKLSIEKRWKAHTRRSRLSNKTHPLVQAINKYGSDNFKLETGATTDSEVKAKLLEIEIISLFGTTDRRFGYNISPGGDYDAKSGAEAMRRRLEDPVFKEKYIATLSSTKKHADWSDYAALTAAMLQWRKNNPRYAYKIGYRSVRIATKAQNRPFTAKDDKSGWYGRLAIDSERVLSARRSYFGRINTKKWWSEMTEKDRASSSYRRSKQIAHIWQNDYDGMCKKISEGVKKSYKNNPNRLQAAIANIEKAKSKVDKKKQGAAASKGLKEYWVKIKSDPIAYKELMDAKREKLREAGLRYYQRRAAEKIFNKR
jgi:hypothetical protein